MSSRVPELVHGWVGEQVGEAGALGVLTVQVGVADVVILGGFELLLHLV